MLINPHKSYFGQNLVFFQPITLNWAIAAAMAVASFVSSRHASKRASSDRAADRAASTAETAEGRKWQREQEITRQGWKQDNSFLGNQLSKEEMNYKIQQEQRNYDSWTNEFGDIQDQVASYYKNLSADTVAGKAYNQLQTNYQQAMQNVQDNMAQRGINPKSGFYNAAELNLDIAKANESAKIAQASEKQVIDTKNAYIQDQASNPYLDGRRAIDMNTSIEQATGDTQKNLYAQLQQEYNQGLISNEQFKAKMGNLGGSQGQQYFNMKGISGDDYKNNGTLSKAMADCQAKNKQAAPGVAGVNAQWINGQCVTKEIPALPKPKLMTPYNSGSGADGGGFGGSLV